MITACDGRLVLSMRDDFFMVSIPFMSQKAFSCKPSRKGFHDAAVGLYNQCDDAIEFYQKLKQDAEQLANELEIKEQA